MALGVEKDLKDNIVGMTLPGEETKVLQIEVAWDTYLLILYDHFFLY